VSSLDELLSTAKESVDSGWLPACQLAVARDGELVAFETFGAADDDTRFCIFSATKPIVASAVWHLIADGSLDVRKRVVDYIPEFGSHGKDVITVEQVMLHTSGFPNAVMDALDGADPARRPLRFANWTLEWEPGTRFEYHATSAHWVLVELLQRLTGSDFRDVIEQRVTAPLGLPRLLGIPEDDQSNIAPLTRVGDARVEDEGLLSLNEPAVRAAGVPGGGAFMTAATLAQFYQGLLRNPGGLWDADVLRDAKTNVRCVFPDPLMGVPVNRTLGLVLAGDDGQHMLRYAIFGADNSPGSIGHAGAHGQVGWADPATGLSFAYATNAVDADVIREAIRSNRLSTLAAALD